MCDDRTEADNDRALTRRTFAAMAAALSLTWARPANAQEVTGRDVVIPTPDGSADAFFVHPNKGKHPGVLIWPDIMGLRPAFRTMATRLAESGYAVLVVNPFYRAAPSPVIAPGETMADPAVRERLFGLAQQLSPQTTETDARAFTAFLDAQRKHVDPKRRIGTTGYCMGGRMTIVTAATAPERIGAAASFHGGGLATAEPDSPHLLIQKTKAGYLVAVAQNDDEEDPDEKERLRAAFQGAGLEAEIEVYAGTRHGWCPPDSRAYDEAQAERAWTRMLALFERTL